MHAQKLCVKRWWNWHRLCFILFIECHLQIAQWEKKRKINFPTFRVMNLNRKVSRSKGILMWSKSELFWPFSRLFIEARRHLVQSRRMHPIRRKTFLFLDSIRKVLEIQWCTINLLFINNESRLPLHKKRRVRRKLWGLKPIKLFQFLTLSLKTCSLCQNCNYSAINNPYKSLTILHSQVIKHWYNWIMSYVVNVLY